MNPRNFFVELKRRNVYKVALAYGVVGWLLIQISTSTFPVLEIPNWAIKLVIALVVLGFPVALILAWAFELTPEGIKRAEDVLPNESITRKSGSKLVGITIALAVIAAGLLAWQFLRPKLTTVVSAPTPTAAPATPVIPDKSIAVLPFENLSSDKENAYFADGIQDEILTKLASVADLKVISRTSTAKYKSRPENLKTVSQELGVATLLEGTVQKAGDKVRVNVQLIDARADTHLWAKSYDGDGKDIFEVESQVSQQVADALRAKLSPTEADTLAKPPTQDAQAYDLFLKGEYELRRAEASLTADAFDRADTFYRQALQREPDFWLATARFALSRLTRHWFVEPLTPEELHEVKTAVDRAVSAAPDLAEAHRALGMFHYFAHRDYEPALIELRRSLELQPNNASTHLSIGAIYRRQGHWQHSLDEMAKAQELDPRDAFVPENIAASYLNLRQWKEARRAAEHSLALDPHTLLAMRVLCRSAINGDGDIAEGKRAFANLPSDARTAPRSVRGNVSSIVDERTYLHVLDRDFGAALKETEKENADAAGQIAQRAARVAIRVLAKTAGSAKAEAEETGRLLEARLLERPGDSSATTQLAWVYLALERKGDALRIAREAAESLPIERDAFVGPVFLVGLAEIEARVGESSEAIKTIRRLLSIPAGQAISLKRLQIDPVWDPIRNDPEFQQLLAGKEQIGPNK